MIQDIYPHQLKNAFVPGKTVSGDDMIVFLQGREAYLLDDNTSDGSLRFPVWDECSAVKQAVQTGEAQIRYLFGLDEKSLFLVFLPVRKKDAGEDGRLAALLPEGGNFYSLRGELRGGNRFPKEMVFAVFTAYHLNVWYQDHRHCGRCGCETVPAADERALDCPACRMRIYPRINPAVIIGVTNGDSLLITRYADRPLSMDALVAGFTEIGETFEQTVQREVMEEAGLKVKNIRYYKSQPWGIESDILAGFYCDVDGDPTVHVDRHELKSALWIPRAEIKGQPNHLSLTNEMMLTFRDGKEPR